MLNDCSAHLAQLNWLQTIKSVIKGAGICHFMPYFYLPEENFVKQTFPRKIQIIMDPSHGYYLYRRPLYLPTLHAKQGQLD